MAILKIKQLIADLENNTTTVLSSMTKLASTATQAGSSNYAGTVYLATTAGNAGVASSAVQAGSANYAGTARVAHFGSSGTGGLAGT